MRTEVERTCDAVAIVDHGRIVRQGPIAELLRTTAASVVEVECDDPTRARELIGEAGIAEAVTLGDTGLTVTLQEGSSRERVAEINRRLVDGGVAVYRLDQARASLEDWFLSVTSRLDDRP